MYRSVKELNDDEISYLKFEMFYNGDNYPTLENWEDIPIEDVFEMYDGIAFVEDDFGAIW